MAYEDLAMITEDMWFEPSDKLRGWAEGAVRLKVLKSFIISSVFIMLGTVFICFMQGLWAAIVLPFIIVGIKDTISYVIRCHKAMDTDLWVYIAEVAEICSNSDYACVLGKNRLVIDVSPLVKEDLCIGEKLVVVRCGDGCIFWRKFDQVRKVL